MLDNEVQVYISSRSSTSAILCSVVQSAGNNHMKFRYQMDCLDVTQVSYVRNLLTAKHQQPMSGSLPILVALSSQVPRQELCYVHQTDLHYKRKGDVVKLRVAIHIFNYVWISMHVSLSLF